MTIENLVNYKIVAIRRPISLISFAIPCRILDAADSYRVADIHFVKKEDIDHAEIENKTITVYCRNGDKIYLTLSDEQ